MRPGARRRSTASDSSRASRSPRSTAAHRGTCSDTVSRRVRASSSRRSPRCASPAVRVRARWCTGCRRTTRSPGKPSSGRRTYARSGAPTSPMPWSRPATSTIAVRCSSRCCTPARPTIWARTRSTRSMRSAWCGRPAGSRCWRTRRPSGSAARVRRASCASSRRPACGGSSWSTPRTAWTGCRRLRGGGRGARPRGHRVERLPRGGQAQPTG